MNHTQNYQEQQEAKRLQNRIYSFLEDFKVGTAAERQRHPQIARGKTSGGVRHHFLLAVLRG